MLSGQNSRTLSRPEEPPELVEKEFENISDTISKKALGLAVAAMFSLVGYLAIRIQSKLVLLVQSSNQHQVDVDILLFIFLVLEGLIIGVGVAVPLSIFERKRVIKKSNRLLKKHTSNFGAIIEELKTVGSPSDKIINYAIIEEEYDGDRRITCRRVTLDVRCIGDVGTRGILITLPKSDYKGRHRDIYLDSAPPDAADPYLVLTKVNGRGSFEEVHGSFDLLGWYGYTFIFADVLTKGGSEILTYEFRYFGNSASEVGSNESIAHIPKTKVQHLRFCVKFAEGVAPEKLHPIEWGPEDEEKQIGNSIKPEKCRGSMDSEVVFDWPTKINGYPTNHFYAHGLSWVWPTNHKKS